MVTLLLSLLLNADGGVSTRAWDEVSKVTLIEGETVRLELKKPVTRVSATDTKACDVTQERDSVLRLSAKTRGTTTVLLWRGPSPKGLEVQVVSATPAPLPVPVVSPSDAGVPFFTWDGEHGFTVPRDIDFVIQGPGGLERVAPGSHLRCQMTSIGNDQLRFHCAQPGPITVLLWYANNRRRVLELDVSK